MSLGSGWPGPCCHVARMSRAFALALSLFALSGCHHDSAGADEGAGRKSDRAVAVGVAKAEHRDVPVWMEGLGSVTAWQQITVRAQVDGRLDKVFFKDGQTVKKGDLLAQIDPRPFEVQLHQAEGALARDTSTLQNAELNLKRQQELLDRKLVAQQAVDDQRAAAQQAAGNVKVDQAAIESARLNLDYARVRAPIDGVVGVRLVDAGNLVHASDAGGLVVLTQLDPIAVFVTVPQDELPRIAAAMQAGEVKAEIQARDGDTKLADGKLYAIDNQINAATATLRVKVQVANPEHRLWPNQFVKVRFLVETVRQALVVPGSALQRGPQGTYVYVVGEDGKVSQRPIEGTPAGDLAILRGKLEAGEQVVTDGQSQLRPGSSVTIRGKTGP
jgi:multidrug efflux system membrane fusion protein